MAMMTREKVVELEVELATLEARLGGVAVNDAARYCEVRAERDAKMVELARARTEFAAQGGRGAMVDIAARYREAQAEEEAAVAAAKAKAAAQPPGPNEELVRRMEEVGLKPGPSQLLAVGFERWDRERKAREGA